MDVAAVPLLWMAPLALYLVTFIVAFEYPKAYHRLTWTMLLLVTLAGAIAAAQADTDVSPAWHMAAGLAVLLASCMFCHGELGMRAPAPVYLTRFYLIVAAGGAAGSAAAALLPPVLSTWVVEYPMSLFAVALAVFAVYASAFRPSDTPKLPWWSRLLAVALVPTMVGLMRFTIESGREQQSSVILSSRNFFGGIRVRESEAPGGGMYRRLLHGNTVHGNQFLSPPRRNQATTYYSTGSGVGQAVQWLRDFGPARLQVGLVGLGRDHPAVLMRRPATSSASTRLTRRWSRCRWGRCRFSPTSRRRRARCRLSRGTRGSASSVRRTTASTCSCSTPSAATPCRLTC